MQKTEPEIKNKFSEKLDTWIETPDKEVKANVIMVHGFGTNKGETAGYFDDIAKALVSDNFRVIRFDLSGYGKSEGKQEEACYSKHVHDVIAILDYVKHNFSELTYLFSQSMGTWITALAKPKGIAKTIFTGIPNSDPQIMIDRFIERFSTRPGAKFNMNSISLLPRSTGEVQKLGKCFWDEIKKIQPVKLVKEYSLVTKLLLVHWGQDEIIGKDFLEEYDNIKTLKSIWLPGNHSVSNPNDRKRFIKIMLDFYNK